jgi:pyridinium-3,5-biscarboxylic acid mononucleotide sulfurtransferase
MEKRDKTFLKKVAELKAGLQQFEKVLVAFSGGKDSFFLLKLALETLGKEKVAACHVKSGFSSRNDQKRVDYFSRQLDFHLGQVEIDLSREKRILGNPRERCYFCKKKIFTALQKKAQTLGIRTILDGTTFSDLNQFRPGLKALEELGILSPLRDAGFTSAEIIAYLQESLGIEDYYLTSSACLATRFPYDMNLEEDRLRLFDQLENFLVESGVFPVKVRYIPEGIRIETPEQRFPQVLALRHQLMDLCKPKGLKLITLDLEGIKSGFWD